MREVAFLVGFVWGLTKITLRVITYVKVEKVRFVTCAEGYECRMHGQDLDDRNTTVNEASTHVDGGFGGCGGHSGGCGSGRRRQ